MRIDLIVGIIYIICSIIMLIEVYDPELILETVIAFGGGCTFIGGIKYICDYVNFRRTNSNTRK